MKKVRFKDLFNFDSSSKLQAGLGRIEGKYPFYTSSPTLSKYYEKYQFSGEHLIFGTGGVASVHYSKNKFAVSTDCLVAIPNNELELFNPKYIYYYLSSHPEILQAGFRGAGLKHISRSYIANISVPLPSFSIQNQIVTVLDKAYFIYDSLNNLSLTFEDLEKSIYYDMFGRKNLEFDTWPLVRLEDLTKDKKVDLRTGPFGSDLLIQEMGLQGDVIVLGIDNAVNNRFKNKENRYITLDKFNSLKKFQVHPRDVIITIMGTIGRSAIIPEDIGLAINTKHLAAITLDNNLANPYYISYSVYLNAEVISQLKAKSRGAIMSGLNLSKVKSIKFRQPSIEKQNEFEKLINYIWIIKSRLETRKEHWNNLIKSLQLESFLFKLQTNIAAFSFDDQMVEFIEKEQVVKASLNEDEKKLNAIRDILKNEYSDRSFSFAEITKAIADHEIQVNYEHKLESSNNEHLRGIKDFMFHFLDSINNNNEPFLRQIFKVDLFRDAEKGKDDSSIMFEINNYAANQD